MKKIYWVGDMKNNTGPAIVNKSYYPYLKNEVKFCFSNNRIIRSLHFCINIFFVDKVVISGFSKLNGYYISLTKMLNKKAIYLMHGYIKEEEKYKDLDVKDSRIELEYSFLNKVDKIICVSAIFADFLKRDLNELESKITFVSNGVELIQNSKQVRKEDKMYIIISVGGGMRRKNNLAVCEAIKTLKLEKIKFLVIGSLLEDGDNIKTYSFVEYIDNLPHEKVLQKMSDADLYIQNSYFETFGLAVLEGLSCGCDLLISSKVGSLSVLSNVNNEDIIFDPNDIQEIGNKIEKKLKKKSSIYYDENKCSWENRSKELLNEIRGACNEVKF